MDAEQQAYDDAMFEFTQGNYDDAIARLQSMIERNPAHFDAQLSLGMAYCRKGDFARAIAEGHKAENLKPHEQLVHTNLSLFYMRAGDKTTAEHHGLQARIASWKGNMAPPSPASAAADESELRLARPAAPPPPKPPAKFPDMPWRAQKRVTPGHDGESTARPVPSAAPLPQPGFVRVESAESLEPGKGRTFSVQGREIAVYRVEHRFFAVDDACPHRGASLGAGHQEHGFLYCPMHGWKFDLATGACESNPERPVRSHEVERRGGEVWVRLSPERVKPKTD